MSQEIKQFHALVKGRVQGVNFRYYTRSRARALGITGYVRNLPDGSVEVVARGSEPALQALLDWLHQGPPAARVREVQVTWQAPYGNFNDFEVRA